MQGLHALFTGEDDTWEAWLSVDTSGFSTVVNFGENSIKLRRGYSPSQSKKPTKVILYKSLVNTSNSQLHDLIPLFYYCYCRTRHIFSLTGHHTHGMCGEGSGGIYCLFFLVITTDNRVVSSYVDQFISNHFLYVSLSLRS